MAALDRMVEGDEFLNGVHPTIADCALAALVGFAKDFYNVAIPPDGRRIVEWYARFPARPSAAPPVYPPELLAIAQGRLEALSRELS